MRAAVLGQLDAASYRCHALHAPECVWVEKNCYIDIWIELLHALQLDPVAMLAFCIGVDFADDQWTFFKPPHTELRDLYGIDVQEMYVWRPLAQHALEHLAQGRFISTEADAFWLPDTAGTDYRTQHTKTTIVLNAIDPAARRLGYFHNAGYHELEGEDFERLFRLGAPPDPAYMPLFAELVHTGRIERRPQASLRAAARALLRRHVSFLPVRNPVRAFEQRFARDLAELSGQGLASYHVWAFGTLRQLGAAAELAALHLRWLEGQARDVAAAIEPYRLISNLCKALILKAARAVNARRPLDAAAQFEQMASAWEQAAGVLRAAPP